MLCKSNICHTYGTARNYLKRKHVNVKRNCILVHIFWTKTLQLGEKILEMPLLSIPGSSLCPVSVMKHTSNLTPMNRESALFSFPNEKAVNYNFYQKFLKNQIKKIGLNPELFSMHSFRRGAVSWAIKNGISESMIQVMGDWKSDCYKMYINCPLDVCCSFTNEFSRRL